MKHTILSALVLSLCMMTSAQAGQTGRDQLILSLTHQVRSLGLDPAPLHDMSPAKLALVKYYVDSGRFAGGEIRQRVAWEFAKERGERSFLFDLLGS